MRVHLAEVGADVETREGADAGAVAAGANSGCSTFVTYPTKSRTRRCNVLPIIPRSSQAWTHYNTPSPSLTNDIIMCFTYASLHLNYIITQLVVSLTRPCTL